MKNLVEADAFTAAVTVPENGDARDAPSVETPFQALTNRTRYMLNRLARVETYCVCEMQNGTYSGGVLVSPNIQYQSGGFTLVAARIVPPAAGKYLLTVSAGLFSSSTANPVRYSMALDFASTLKVFGYLHRHSASTVDPVVGSASVALDITSTNDRLGIVFDGGNPTVTNASFYSQIILRRLS